MGNTPAHEPRKRLYSDSSLAYSSLNNTKITQSLYLTDAITDDSYSSLHMALQIQISCNQLTEKCTLPLLCLML